MADTSRLNRWQVCTKRQIFNTPEEARAYVETRALRPADGTQLDRFRFRCHDHYGYRCPFCDRWHVTESWTASSVYQWQFDNGLYWGNQV